MRPYLLRKFRNRPCREIREVPKEAFARLREGLLEYARDNKTGTTSIPSAPTKEFFSAVEGMMTATDFSVDDLAVCEEEGRLSVTGLYSDMDTIYDVNILETAGMDHIADPGLKQLVFDFVATFIHGNNLTAYEDTVWNMLVEEEDHDIEGWDIPEEEKESLLVSMNLMNEECEPTRQLKDAMKDSCFSTDSLRERIEAFSPGDERDASTLEVLKLGLAWLDELASLLDDCDCSYGYASVEVTPWDRFLYVTADHGIPETGWAIIDGAYGGDAYYHDLPVRFSIDETGAMKKGTDLDGFCLYMERLSEQLNKYLTANE